MESCMISTIIHPQGCVLGMKGGSSPRSRCLQGKQTSAWEDRSGIDLIYPSWRSQGLLVLYNCSDRQHEPTGPASGKPIHALKLALTSTTA